MEMINNSPEATIAIIAFLSLVLARVVVTEKKAYKESNKVADDCVKKINDCLND